jgi:hypothetical protein
MRQWINLVESMHYVDVTELPEFAQWFRGSKIVDDSGKPLRVYHGTTQDFESFGGEDAEMPYRGGIIAFFSTSTEFASGYATDHPGANVKPCYLRCRKPFDFRKHWQQAEYFWEDTGGIYDRSEINRILMGLGVQDIEMDTEGTSLTQEQFVNAIKEGSWDALEAPEFVHYLVEDGWDCIITLENGAINFGIFDPRQVKSAYARNFDAHDERFGE